MLRRGVYRLHVRLTISLAAILLVAGVCLAPAVQPAGATADVIAVSLSGENAVAFVEPDTGKTIGRFAVGQGPHELIGSFDGSRVYVANAGGSSGESRGRSVSVLARQGTAAVIQHDLGEHRSPHDVRVSRDGSLLWVAVAPSRAVLELDARTGAIRRTWQTDVDGGWFVAVTPDDRKIYVPHLEGKSVTAIDRSTGRRTTVLAGGAQSGIDVSPDGRQVWVIEHERQRLNVIDAQTDSVIARVALPLNTFGRLRFSPDGRLVVLVQDKRLSTIDRVSRKETGSVTMPRDAKVVAVSPDGTRAVVSNPAADSITIVDLGAMRVVASHAVGKTPDGVYWLRGTR